MDLLKA